MPKKVVMPRKNQLIARVQTYGAAGNQWLVHDENNAAYTARVSPAFKRASLIQQGRFVFLRPLTTPGPVKGEIVFVLSDQNISNLRQRGAWPPLFESYAGASATASSSKQADQDSRDDFDDYDMDYDSEEASAYAHEMAAEHYYRDSD